MISITYGWIIDRDHLEGGREAGVMGPRDISADHMAALDRGEGLAFRMLDDDEELYYSGRIVGIGSDTSDLPEEAFAPLSDYGEPGAGCTMIQYRVAGKWVTL